jgi:hypothetical protein
MSWRIGAGPVLGERDADPELNVRRGVGDMHGRHGQHDTPIELDLKNRDEGVTPLWQQVRWSTARGAAMAWESVSAVACVPRRLGVGGAKVERNGRWPAPGMLIELVARRVR